MTLREAISKVLFENPATQALAEEAVDHYDTAIEQGDDKAAAKWHAQALSCCRGRPSKGSGADAERRRMADALSTPDEDARAHAAAFASETEA